MFFSIVFFSLLPLISADCPSGSLAYQDRCYQFISAPATFLQAEENCVVLNGHLTSVRNAFESSFFSANPTFTSDDYWLGGSLLEGSNWSWIDGTTFSYSNWAAQQPTANNCLSTAASTNLWSAGDCTQSKPYICSVTPLPTTPSYSHTPPCGQFWYDKDINSCFYVSVSSAALSFYDAERACQQNGYHLASILSNEDRMFFPKHVKKEGYVWFGLYRNGTDQNWSFTDSSPMYYTNWATNEPPNWNGNVCVALDSDNNDQTWVTHSCTAVFKSWICRRPVFL